MKASVGDRIVIAAPTLGQPVRDGEILEVRGHGRYAAIPRAMVRRRSPNAVLPRSRRATRALCPCTRARAPSDHPEPTTAPTTSTASPDTRRHVQHWQVDINLYEDGDTTTADAVLHTPAPRALKSRGKAHRRPDDPDVPEIGDEIAAAHALRRLASHLMDVAESDLQGVHPSTSD